MRQESLQVSVLLPCRKIEGRSSSPPLMRIETSSPLTSFKPLLQTFFQLDNSRGSEPAQVLYLTSPSYIFEPSETTDAAPAYDDAVTVGSDWKRLAEHNWNPPELCDPARSYASRQNALQ